MTAALEGIKVVDLCSVVSGPVAMATLADQGADVIKVEGLTGDVTRGARPESPGFAPGFVACNRGKRSIALDLKNADGQAILWRLLERADVVAQNYRPGVMERLGFGYETVAARNPGIVFLSISGVGPAGPYAKKRVYDPTIQSLTGFTDIQADPITRRPKMVRTLVADKTTAIYAAQAVTAALFARTRTGKGQHLQVSMLDVMMSFLWPEGMAPFAVVAEDRRDAPNTPHDMIFETSDGYVTFGTVSDKEWAGLCKALKRPELIADKRFATGAQRSTNRQVRMETVEAAIAGFSSDEIIARLEANDVPCMKVKTRREALDDPQVIANEIVVEMDQPGVGRMRQARPAALFGDTPSHSPRPAPGLGQHSREILSEVGFEDAEIAALIGRGVVGAAS
ncbi:MAG: CoA transferase [Rhodospirillaceae bacterium]|nr:CoA transferase [Rhodospirillaceae bacterium]MDD9917064.1 CoA transferase [Rhodospirillaceae bacterium]MDD9924517.1 CoA transferase [Rhodospirillaceae bacterium]